VESLLESALFHLKCCPLSFPGSAWAGFLAEWPKSEGRLRSRSYYSRTSVPVRNGSPLHASTARGMIRSRGRSSKAGPVGHCCGFALSTPRCIALNKTTDRRIASCYPQPWLPRVLRAARATGRPPPVGTRSRRKSSRTCHVHDGSVVRSESSKESLKSCVSLSLVPGFLHDSIWPSGASSTASATPPKTPRTGPSSPR